MPHASEAEIIRQIEALLALPFMQVTMLDLEKAHAELDRADREMTRRRNRSKAISMVHFKAHDDTEQFFYSLAYHRQRVKHDPEWDDPSRIVRLALGPRRVNKGAHAIRDARGRAMDRLIVRSFTETDQQRLRRETRGPVATDLEEQRGR